MAGLVIWLERLTLGIYSCLVWVMQPLLKRKLRRRALHEPEYGKSMAERFGYYSDLPSAGWLWVHAVSLGETRAAELLIAQIRSIRPGVSLLLSHSTATGWAAGSPLLRTGDRQVWLPWDTKGATQQFLRHFQPALGVLMETEVWPNLMRMCANQNVPVVLANARLNESSFASARRLRLLSRPAYSRLNLVLAQTGVDAGRLDLLGVRQSEVLGNIKFDAQPDTDQVAKGRKWRRELTKSVVALISSRDGEEVSFVEAIRNMTLVGNPTSAADSNFQFMIVPRHPQRVDEVANLCLSRGLSVSRRSEWTLQPKNADVWLGDSMGELSLYYAMCHVALLGGSFGRFGGQNLIEAAACGCPLVMGPHTYNFSQAAQWSEKSGAARRSVDLPGALANALDWISQPEALARAEEHCRKFASAHRGASRKTAMRVLELVPTTNKG